MLLSYVYTALLSCLDSASPATCTTERLEQIVPWLTCSLDLQECAFLYAVNQTNHTHFQDAIICSSDLPAS